MRKYNTFSIIFCIFLIIFFLKGTYANDYYSSAPGTTIIIYEHSICNEVVNNRDNTVFIPTSTSEEWSSFRNAPPEDMSLNVCVQDCAGVWGGDASDQGCGCGQPGPSGCDNVCGSTLTTDACGVCGGSGHYDSCGTCDSDPGNDCTPCCRDSNGNELSYPNSQCSSISNVFPCSPPPPACFHPESIVELENGTKRMARDIEYGDKVKTTDDKGNIIYSEIVKDYYFNNKEEEEEFPYVVIEVGGNKLRVTLLHNIFVDNLKKNINAYKIKPGMYVNVLEGDEIVLSKVEKVTFENLTGKYDLYNEVGKVIVDNIVVGTLAFYPQEKALFWWKYFNKHPKQYLMGYKYVYAPAFKEAHKEALEEIKEELETINPEIDHFN